MTSPSTKCDAASDPRLAKVHMVARRDFLVAGAAVAAGTCLHGTLVHAEAAKPPVRPTAPVTDQDREYMRLALVQMRKAHQGPQLPRFRPLLPGDSDGLTKTRLGSFLETGTSGAHQKFAMKAMQLCLVEPLPGAVGDGQRLDHERARLIEPARLRIRSCLQSRRVGANQLRTGRFRRLLTLGHQRATFVATFLFGQCGAP